MQTSTYTYIRQNLATVMDNIVLNHTPMVVTRQKKRSSSYTFIG